MEGPQELGLRPVAFPEGHYKARRETLAEDGGSPDPTEWRRGLNELKPFRSLEGLTALQLKPQREQLPCALEAAALEPGKICQASAPQRHRETETFS